MLVRGSESVPLIPRYFDLLVLLLERRQQALHRREIRDAVWGDVVVSDGALSQAVRTLRRALGDDSREPSFIRTVSRHGYRFVHDRVIEEPDDAPLACAAEASSVPADGDPIETALAALLAPGRLHDGEPDNDERRAAAEALHALGTSEALRRLDRRPGHARARALLRDARWDVPGAGPVPLLGAPGVLPAAFALAALRLRRALRLAGSRWTAAASGGALAGAVAGLIGGVALALARGTPAARSAPVGLAVIGAIVGSVGAAGVGAGLAAAEMLARSFRGVALVGLGALGGGAVGSLAHTIGRSTLEGLFGGDLSAVGGGAEGFVLGAAAGLGYAITTPRPDGGMATPRGGNRLRAAMITGLTCALAGVALTAFGGHLAGASLNQLARSFDGSALRLEPLARILGERELGPLSRGVLAAWEGMFFGLGLVLGLTRRPR
jgi:DNA-binding winged helix-turn-helix (wHTH) protein